MNQINVQRPSSERQQLSTEEQSALWTLLDTLTDPEIPVVTLREMGILRALRRGSDGAVEVVITPTYSGCPAMDQIADDIAATLREAGVRGRVVTQLAPAWTTDWMSEAAREKLRAYGIAPPPKGAAAASLKNQAPAECPRCGSSETEEISRFGSTPCKALWRCTACAEPFDRFKCH